MRHWLSWFKGPTPWILTFPIFVCFSLLPHVSSIPTNTQLWTIRLSRHIWGFMSISLTTGSLACSRLWCHRPATYLCIIPPKQSGEGGWHLAELLIDPFELQRGCALSWWWLGHKSVKRRVSASLSIAPLHSRTLWYCSWKGLEWQTDRAWKLHIWVVVKA